MAESLNESSSFKDKLISTWVLRTPVASWRPRRQFVPLEIPRLYDLIPNILGWFSPFKKKTGYFVDETYKFFIFYASPASFTLEFSKWRMNVWRMTQHLFRPLPPNPVLATCLASTLSNYEFVQWHIFYPMISRKFAPRAIRRFACENSWFMGYAARLSVPCRAHDPFNGKE